MTSDIYSNTSDETKPELTVVIAIIAGGCEPMAACLEKLEADVCRRRIECIVPYDDRLDSVAELSTRFPWAHFVDSRQEVNSTQYGDSSREHHDILRAIGLR